MLPRAAKLLLLPLIVASGYASGAQAPLEGAEPVRAASTNVVDLISQDGDLSLFMRLLQRARLIPTLNKMHNVTLFAPTNDALRNRSLADPELQAWLQADEAEPLQDNLQYRLRERLFYHMLNYTGDLSFPDPMHDIAYESTLLFPTKHEDHGRPGHVPYPDPQDTLLGGEGQKLPVTRKDGKLVKLGVAQDGSGGASIVSERGGDGRNGRVQVIDDVLEPPHSVAHILKAREASSDKADASSLSKFSSLLSEHLWKTMREGSHITLFAPQDKAFDVLEPLEWKYLQSGFAADDILEISNNHRTQYKGDEAHRQKVGYLDRLISLKNVPVMSGDTVAVSEKGKSVSINGSTIAEGNILASNGVVHIVDSLLLPKGSLALTPEKYLLALNASRFVGLFRDAGLSHLLQSSKHNEQNNASYTILAAKDDVLERMSSLPWMSLPEAGTTELKDTLRYHIIEGRYTKDKLNDGELLKTMLKTPQLRDQQQRVVVSVSDSKHQHLAKEDSAISFGTANVIAEPIEAGNSIIYLISRILEPPTSFVATALDKGLSTFVASVYASGLDRKLLHESPATTFLAPTNAAFDYLGLAMNYFLLPSAQEELGRLLSYHAVQGTLYLDEVDYDSQHFSTLEGSDIYLERNSSSSKAKPHTRVRGPLVGGFPTNGDNRAAKIVEADLLTSTGVLHVIDQVELPPTINITSDKLMRGAKASTFPDLLRQANLSWVAEGKPAPADWENYSPFINLKKRDQKRLRKSLFQHTSYTLLCPTDKAFNRINLTHYLNDLPALLSLVQLHVIPSPPPGRSSLEDPMRFPADGRPLTLEDDLSFATLHSKSQGGPSRYGDVSFRKAGESDWLVGIKGARGTDGKHDNARILNHGRNTPIIRRDSNDLEISLARPKTTFGGGVFLIDGVLEPYEPNWWRRWGYIVLIAVISTAAAACIGVLLWKLYDRKKQERLYYEALREDAEED